MRRTSFHFLRHTVIFVQTRRQAHCAHEDESEEEWSADCGGARFHGARENTFSICQTQEKSVCYGLKPKKWRKLLRSVPWQALAFLYKTSVSRQDKHRSLHVPILHCKQISFHPASHKFLATSDSLHDALLFGPEKPYLDDIEYRYLTFVLQ